MADLNDGVTMLTNDMLDGVTGGYTDKELEQAKEALKDCKYKGFSKPFIISFLQNNPTSPLLKPLTDVMTIDEAVGIVNKYYDSL